MSYFNDKFNTPVYIFEAGKEYPAETIIKYNNYLYIAKKDTDSIPVDKTTDENWEFISPDSTTKVIANLGCTNNGYPISIGTQNEPFYSVNVMNSINLTAKNKSIVPGFMGTLRFGRDMSDKGSTVNMNVLYDSDYQNPAFIGMTESLNEIDLGSGIYRFKDIYSTSSPITVADDKYMGSYSEVSDKYMELISGLEPVQYTLNSEYSTSNRTHIGFLAKDIEQKMEELELSSDEFAGLVKIPVLKKDIYKDFEINEPSFGHYHYEENEEVADTEENYKDYSTGQNIIRYCNLPIYREELGYIYFKNYPIGSFDNVTDTDDMNIVVKRIELIPFDESQDNYVLEFSQLDITDDYPFQNEAHHEILSDGSLLIKYDESAVYKYVRISLTPNAKPLDCTKYKYIKIISDFQQPYLLGFSDIESAQRIDNGVDYFTSEYGDLYSYAQDNQYEVATYIYALRYSELFPLYAKKIQQIQLLEDKLMSLSLRLEDLESKLENSEKAKENNEV